MGPRLHDRVVGNLGSGDALFVLLTRNLLLRKKLFIARDVVVQFFRVGLRLCELRARVRHSARPAFDLRFRLCAADVDIQLTRARVGETVVVVGLRAFHRHAVIGRIDLHEHGTRLHELPIIGEHARDMSADLGADGIDVAIDLRVVRTLEVPRVQPPNDDDDDRHDEDDRHDDPEDAFLAFALLRILFFFLLRLFFLRHPLLLLRSRQKTKDRSLGIAGRSCQHRLGHVMRIHAGDGLLVRRCHRLLRLDDFNVVR